MGTRGAIARPSDRHEGAFEGRYHHWDSYPSGLGATLFQERNGFFAGDTGALLKYLIDDHPAGWSTIVGKDLSRPAGFAHDTLPGDALPCLQCGKNGSAHLCQTSGPSTVKHRRQYPCGGGLYSLHLGHTHAPDPEAVADQALVPECYCHGSRNEEGWLTTEQDAAGAGVEYVYVLDDNVMHVLSSYRADGKKMIGMFGMGDPDATWQGIARIDLDGPEPDWEQIG